jgi:hypothetical protein
MSLDRQRIDNLSALEAGLPIPRYGRPQISDSSIHKQIEKLKERSVWTSYFNSFLYPVFKLFKIDHMLMTTDKEMLSLYRQILYPFPNFISDKQVVLFYDANDIRSFNHRTWEHVIYNTNIFMSAYNNIMDGYEQNMDMLQLNFFNMITYRRNACTSLYNIQYSVDSRYENVIALIRKTLYLLDTDLKWYLTNGRTHLNAIRLAAGWPEIPDANEPGEFDYD